MYYKINKYLGSKSAILHIADDNGETTALLALQQPQRKIFTYIANEEKRDVAKANYINRTRSITYISSIEDRAYDIIIADADNTIPVYKANRIVIIKDVGEEPISGFEVEVKGEGFIILRKI